MTLVARMSGGELKSERVSRGMTGSEFGAFLAAALGRERAYDRREISVWETGAASVPEAVERVLLRLRLAQS